MHAAAARNVTFRGETLTVMALRKDEHVGSSILYSGEPFEANTVSTYHHKLCM